MKNLVIYLLIVGLVLLSACSDIDERSLAEQSSKKTEFTISATLEELNADEDTRAIVEPVLRLKWYAGDKISVVNLTSGKILGGALEANMGGYTTQFSGTLSGRLYYGDVLGFIYPAFGNEEEQDFENFAIDLSEQDGTEMEQDKIVLIGENKFTYKGGSTRNISISFKYLVNFQRVMLSNLPESTKINEVSLSGVGTNVKLSINSNQASGFDVNSPDVGTIVVTPSGMSTNDTGGKSIYVKVPTTGKNPDRKMKVLTEDGDFIATYNSAAINAGYFTIRIVPNLHRIINFPDESFMEYMLKGYDANKDGLITLDEAEEVIAIDCSGESDENRGNIKSLEGIEYCTNLEELYCQYNQIEELDLSQNKQLVHLSCAWNKIETIKVPEKGWINIPLGSQVKLEYPKISYIDCRCNELTSMDFMKDCYDLRYLFSGVNKYSSIDVSNCRNLVQLGCDSNFGLTSLDLSGNKNLEVLYCSNTSLTELDLNNNTKLRVINCGDNPYTTPIDFSPLKNSLEEVWIANYRFDNFLGLSECSKITFLRTHENDRSLEMKFDLSKFPLLETFDCSNSNVSTLDLSHNENLVALHCTGCNLSVLDFSGNPNLQYIDCRYNDLTILDLRPTSVWKGQYPNKFNEMVWPSYEWNDGFPVLCAGNPLTEVILLEGWQGKIGGFYEGKTHELCIGDNLSIVKYKDLSGIVGENGSD